MSAKKNKNAKPSNKPKPSKQKRMMKFFIYLMIFAMLLSTITIGLSYMAYL